MRNTYVHIVFNTYMPDNRIMLIKHLRAVFGCTLYNAKALTEKCGIYKFDSERGFWNLCDTDTLCSHGGVIVRLSTPEHIKPFSADWRDSVTAAAEYFSVHPAQEPPPIQEL